MGEGERGVGEGGRGAEEGGRGAGEGGRGAGEGGREAGEGGREVEEGGRQVGEERLRREVRRGLVLSKPCNFSILVTHFSEIFFTIFPLIQVSFDSFPLTATMSSSLRLAVESSIPALHDLHQAVIALCWLSYPARCLATVQQYLISITLRVSVTHVFQSGPKTT